MPLFLCQVTEADDRPYTNVVRADNHGEAARLLAAEVELSPGDTVLASVRRLAETEVHGPLGAGSAKSFELAWNPFGCKAATLVGGREPSDLSREELIAAMNSVIGEMYHEGPQTAWDAGTIEEVAQVLDRHNLIPPG